MGLKSLKAIDLEKVRKQPYPENPEKKKPAVPGLYQQWTEEIRQRDEKISVIISILTGLSMEAALIVLECTKTRLFEKVQVKL